MVIKKALTCINACVFESKVNRKRVSGVDIRGYCLESLSGGLANAKKPF